MRTQTQDTHDTDEGHTHLQVRIPVERHNRLKVRVAQEQTTMTEVVNNAVEQYLATAPGKSRR